MWVEVGVQSELSSGPVAVTSPMSTSSLGQTPSAFKHFFKCFFFFFSLI